MFILLETREREREFNHEKRLLRHWSWLVPQEPLKDDIDEEEREPITRKKATDVRRKLWSKRRSEERLLFEMGGEVGEGPFTSCCAKCNVVLFTKPVPPFQTEICGG